MGTPPAANGSVGIPTGERVCRPLPKYLGTPCCDARSSDPAGSARASPTSHPAKPHSSPRGRVTRAIGLGAERTQRGRKQQNIVRLFKTGHRLSHEPTSRVGKRRGERRNFILESWEVRAPPARSPEPAGSETICGLRDRADPAPLQARGAACLEETAFPHHPTWPFQKL